MNDTCICDNVPKVWRLTGVTRTLRLRIFNPDGTPLDLTGRTVAVTIARDNSEFVYAPGFVIEGDDNNVVKFEWPADQQGAGDYTINVTTTDGSGNADRVNWHGPTGIRLVDFSFMVRGEDALGVTSEANIGLDGTFTMNGTGMSAYDEWLAEGHTGTPEEFIAWLRQPATDAATEAAATVDAKMAEVDADMATIEATAAADHTRAGSDHTTATGDHTRAEADHAQAITDSQQAATDHKQAEIDAAAAASDREKAATDRTKAANDRQQAAVDHGTAAQDHATASSDHQQAQSDHSTASADHTKATQDAERAASDHTRAGDDHDTAVADHHSAESDHTRAEADHTTAAADHTTAASDHTQATADHKVMAGYDTRLGNVEGEVSQLGQKVNGINVAITQDDVSATALSRWYANNGKVASDSSGVLNRVEMIPVVAGSHLTLKTTLSYATNPAGFICDDEDNILVTIARVGATTTYSGTIPEGATRLYVNYVSTLAISLTKAGKQDQLTFDDTPIEGSNNPVKSGGIYPIAAEVNGIKEYLYGEQFEKSASVNLVAGTGIEQTLPVDSIPLSANKKYKVEITGTRTNGTRITFYLRDESGTNNLLFRISTNEADLDTKSEVTNSTINSTTSIVWVKPSVNTNRIKLFSAAADVKDTTELTLTFTRQEEGIEERIDEQGEEIVKINADLATVNEKIGTNDLSGIPFSADYLIWTISDNKVTASSSSYPSQRNISPIPVQPGGSVTITQTIQGTANKAIFADDEDNVIAFVPYTGTVSNYEVPEGATRLYINRKSGTTFELLYKSATSAKFDKIIAGNTGDKFPLPLYAPSPQKAADGQDGTLDAENSTSGQVFAKCDEAIAKYTNYAVGEVIGKDATNTYDIKRYALCKADMFAWKASDSLYAWKTGTTTRYIKSCSPRVGESIYGDANTVVATVASFDSTTGVMIDSGNTSYSRVKTSDIPADVIYTIREKFTFSFDIYRKNGTVITRLETSAWDSGTNTISYNSKTYSRARFYDWNSNGKATIVLWGNEHAAQSDPHEPSIVLYRLIRDLCQSGPSGNKFLSFLKNYCKLVILPIVNVYGYTKYATEKNTGGRLNGNGVNLNRNYPTTGWSAGTSGMNYGGTYGGSEIEVQYVINTCIEFGANVGVDIHCLSYVTEANENNCAYGGNFSDLDAEKQDVISVGKSMLADYSISLVNYGKASATGEGEGKNWLLANEIEGGLIEMNAGAYALQYDGNQHTALVLEADYSLLLRMLNVWNNRFSNTMNLANYQEG